MTAIRNLMTDDHRRCDDLLADMENAANTNSIHEKYLQFKNAMEHHFCMEEKIIFPAMVKITGSEMGPIMVMKMEHEQMRNVFQRMDSCVQNDAEEFLSLAETLNILIQQHNSKEEQVLYPMAEQLLQATAANVLDSLKSDICGKG